MLQLCVRGRTHVFKYLERQAAKNERARCGRTKKGLLDSSRGHATLDTRSHKRHNIDSGYSTSDGLDKRWSQEFNSTVSFRIIFTCLSCFHVSIFWLFIYTFDALYLNFEKVFNLRIYYLFYFLAFNFKHIKSIAIQIVNRLFDPALMLLTAIIFCAFLPNGIQPIL